MPGAAGAGAPDTRRTAAGQDRAVDDDPETVERVRRVLAPRSGAVEKRVVEKRMVGGRSFTVDGHLCCGVTSRGLVVRVGADAVAAALAEPDVQPMEMGGRRLAAFVLVEPQGYADDAALQRWVERALDVVAGLP